MKLRFDTMKCLYLHEKLLVAKLIFTMLDLNLLGIKTNMSPQVFVSICSLQTLVLARTLRGVNQTRNSFKLLFLL